MSAQIFPIVGAAPLVLPDPLPTQDVSDGTPGAATPATAIQVAGTDGTDLRTLLTDNTGQLKILVENASAIATTDKADGTPGSAVPATALQVAGTDGTDLQTLLTDTSGRQEVVGAAASGAAVTGNPVLVAGQDGTDARTLLTDNTGQLKVLVENGSAIAVSGTVTAEIEGHAGGVLDAVVGAAIPANAVLIGGNEAGNIEPLLLDASGFLKVNVAAGSAGNAAASATGSAVPADADYLGASDGTDLQGLLVESATHPNLRVALYNGAVEAVVDAQGGVKVSGEAASGSAVTGNPVLVAGQDGTDARTLLTDNTGQLKVLVEGGTGATVTAEIEGHAGGVLDAVVGAAVPANAIQVAGSDGTDLRALLTDSSGRQEVVGAAASGAAVTGNPVLIGGSDGTDARTLLTDNTGQLKILDVADVAQASTTSGQVGPLVQMATVTSAPTDSNATTNPLRGDAGGCLRTNPAGQTGSYGTTYATGSGSALPTITVPAGKKWLLQAMQLTFTVANSGSARTCGVYVKDASSHTIAAIYFGVAATTNTTTAYSVGQGMPYSTSIVQSNASAPFPPISLGPGCEILALEISGVAGDTVDLLASYTAYND